jgi:hypothetical protein
MAGEVRPSQKALAVSVRPFAPSAPLAKECREAIIPASTNSR